MLPSKIAFVDIETTGGRSLFDRIIEIGIIRIEDNKIVSTYNSLINPQTHLPSIITTLTGITADDLENAPTFREVSRDIRELLADCVFAAHNVRFDYGFLKSEFKRQEITFNAKHFCTVRLSRLLYPQFPRHNLDALIERFNFTCKNRHRALDDATVLHDFYQRIQKEFAPDILLDAMNKTLKKPSLPLKLTQEVLDDLPEGPGVYIFYGSPPRDDSGSVTGETGKPLKKDLADTLGLANISANTIPLYIGKSKNIKNRVLNHFSSDIHSPLEMKISQQIESIETIKTAGELGALLLESELIKKMLPLYNQKSRIKKELVAIKTKINGDGYQECFLEPVTTINPQKLESFLGIFKSRKQAKNFLADIAREYELCEKMLGLEKTKGPCFAYRLNRCKGACTGLEKALFYNMRVFTAFTATKIHSWPFKGPVLIEEAQIDGKKEYFLIDKWCHVGTIVIDGEGNKKSDLRSDYSFDLDVYHIIKQYLRSQQNVQKIKVVPSNEIPSLFDDYQSLAITAD